MRGKGMWLASAGLGALMAGLMTAAAASASPIVIVNNGTVVGGILAVNTGTGTITITNNGTVTNPAGAAILASADQGAITIANNGPATGSTYGVLGINKSPNGVTITDIAAVQGGAGGLGLGAIDKGSGLASITTGSGTSGSPITVTDIGGSAIVAETSTGAAAVKIGDFNTVTAGGPGLSALTGAAAIALNTTADASGPTSSLGVGANDTFTVQGNNSSGLSAQVGIAGSGGPNGTAGVAVTVGAGFSDHVSGLSSVGVIGFVADPSGKGTYGGSGNVSIAIGTGSIVVDEAGAVGTPAGAGVNSGVSAISFGGNVSIDNAAVVVVSGGLDASLGLTTFTAGSGTSTINSHATVTSLNGDAIKAVTTDGANTLALLGGQVISLGGDGVDVIANGAGAAAVVSSAGTDVRTLSPGAFFGVSATSASGSATVATFGTVSDGGVRASAGGFGGATVVTGDAVNNSNGQGVSATASQGPVVVIDNGAITATGDGILAQASGPAGVSIAVNKGLVSLGPVAVEALNLSSGSASVTVASGTGKAPLTIGNPTVAGIVAESITGPAAVTLGNHDGVTAGAPGVSTGADVAAVGLFANADVGATPIASVTAGTGDSFTMQGNNSAAIAAHTGSSGGGGPNGTASAAISVGNSVAMHVSGFSDAGLIGFVADPSGKGTFGGSGAVTITVGTGSILVDEVGAVGSPAGAASSGIAAISFGGNVLIDNAADVTVTGGLGGSLGLVAFTAGAGTSTIQSRASVTSGNGDGVKATTANGANTVNLIGGKVIATGGDGVHAIANGSGAVAVNTAAGTHVASLSPGAFSGIAATGGVGSVSVNTLGAVDDGGVLASTGGTGSVLVQTSAAVTNTNGDGIRAQTSAGADNVNVAAGKIIATGGDGIDAVASGPGSVNVDTLAGTTVKTLSPGAFRGVSASSGAGNVTVVTLGNVSDGGVLGAAGGFGNVTLVAGGSVANSAGDGMDGSAAAGSVTIVNTGPVTASGGGLFGQRSGGASGTVFVQASGPVSAGTGAAVRALNNGQGAAEALADDNQVIKSAGGGGVLSVAIGGQAISFIGLSSTVNVGAPGISAIGGVSAISAAFADVGGPSAQAVVSNGAAVTVRGNSSAGVDAENRLPGGFGGTGGSSVTVADGATITVHGFNDAGLFADNLDTSGAGAFATAGAAAVVAGADVITVNESGAAGVAPAGSINAGIGALSAGGNVSVASAATITVGGGTDTTLGIVTFTAGPGASTVTSTGAIVSKQGDGVKTTTSNGMNTVTLAGGSVSAPNGSAINAAASGAGVVKITVGAGVSVSGHNGVVGTAGTGLLIMSTSGTIIAGPGGAGVLFTSGAGMTIDNHVGGVITGVGSSVALQAGGAGLLSLTNEGSLGGTKVQPSGQAIVITGSGGMALDNVAGASLNGTITGADNITVTNEGTWATRGTSNFGTAGGAASDSFTNTGLVQVGDNDPASAATNSQFDNLGAFRNGSASATGTISMINSHEGDVLTMNAPFIAASGHSLLGLDAFLGGPGSKADQLRLLQGSSGQTLIDIHDTNTGAGALNAKGIIVVQGQTSFSDFALDPSQPNYDATAHGIDHGLFVYVLSNVKGNEALVGLPGLGAAQLAAMGGAVAQVFSSTTPGTDTATGLMAALVSGDAEPSGAGPRVWSKALNWGESRLNGGQTQFGAHFGTTADVGQPVMALAGLASVPTEVSSGGTEFNLNGGYAQNTSSLTTGVDLVRHVGQTDAWVWGVSGGYVESEQSFAAPGSAPALYSGAMATVQGAYIRGGFYLDGDLKLDVLHASFLGPWQGATRQGSMAASFGAEGEAGYRLALSAHWTLEPVASLALERTSFSGMTLDGAQVRFPNADSLKGSVGVKLAADYDVRGYKVTARAAARVWDEFGAASGLQFDGVTSNLVPFGPGRGALGDISASVNVAKLGQHTSAFVSTAYQMGAAYKAEAVLAGFKLAW